MATSPGTQTSSCRAAVLALLVSVPIPTLGAYLAMIAFPEDTWAKVLFFVAKLWMLAVPVLWLMFIAKQKPRLPRWSNRGMLAAHVTGVLIFLIILGAYFGFAHAWVDFEPMREKIASMSLDNPLLYLAGAAYWCTVNSLLEEYFWRWFTFARLADLMPRGPQGVKTAGVVAAVVLSGLLFTAHHIFALDVYFDWRITTLGSLGVFIGGVTWSALYAKYRNIYAGWVSHIWADLAVFGLGWLLIFGD